VQNGVHFQFFQKAKQVMDQEGFEKVGNQFALIMDEMKIKSGLDEGGGGDGIRDHGSTPTLLWSVRSPSI